MKNEALLAELRYPSLKYGSNELRDRLVSLAQHYGFDIDAAFDAADLIVRTKHCHDNATPAGNATLVGVFARLWVLEGDNAWRDKADRCRSAAQSCTSTPTWWKPFSPFLYMSR